jgi:putative ABC transport system permease protein
LVARTPTMTSQYLLADIRRIIATVDPSVPVPEVLPLRDISAQSIAGRRMRAIPATGFALLALAVSAVGIVATLSALLAERRRDLAICAALGATRRHLMWTIQRQGFGLTVAGLAAGLAASAVVTRGLASMLYGIRPSDGMTYVVTAAIVASTSLVATTASSFRTLHIDPVVDLRRD